MELNWTYAQAQLSTCLHPTSPYILPHTVFIQHIFISSQLHWYMCNNLLIDLFTFSTALAVLFLYLYLYGNVVLSYKRTVQCIIGPIHSHFIYYILNVLACIVKMILIRYVMCDCTIGNAWDFAVLCVVTIKESNLIDDIYNAILKIQILTINLNSVLTFWPF